MIGIYKITNKTNKKCYIGQSVDIEHRFRKHQTDAFWNSNKNFKYNYPLYQAFRKYGIDSFLFEILEECKEEDLDAKEQFYYDLFQPAYCLTAPEEKVVKNEEVRKKISEKLTGRTLSESHKQRMKEVTKYDNNHNAKQVELIKDGNSFIFNSTSLAAKWLIDNKITSSSNERQVSQMVSRAARKERKQYLGFEINYK